MSETENPDRKSPVVDADFDEPDYEPESADPTPPQRRAGTSASIAWLALFLALAAVAAAGTLFVRDLRDAAEADAAGDTVAALRRDTADRLDESRESVAALESRLDEIGEAAGTNSEALADLESAVADLAQYSATLESVAPRIRSLENSLANLQGISVDARNSFLLAEAEYYMQIANAQLQLAGNAELAALALEQADDRVAQLGDPGLTEVRRSLADEMAALEVMEDPDIAGVTLTLGSLAQVIDSLPLRGPDTNAARPATAPDEEIGGLRRAWNSVKDAFSGVFDYTPPTDPDRPLLTPGSEPLIRGNLALQLQAARLALLRGEQDLFRQSLDDADAWIETWFDTSTAPVTSARETIREIREAYRRVAKPDISGSLRLLRQYRTLAGSSTGEPAE